MSTPTTSPPNELPPASTGVWLAASAALGRPVPVDEPYPHIHGCRFVGLMTGRLVRLGWRDCAACHIESQTVAAGHAGDAPVALAPVFDLATRRRVA